MTAAHIPSPADRKNPYIGPRAFGVGERLPNRESEARDVADLVIAERILLLHSPSGAGKTSLLQAAVMPMLQADGFHPIGPVRVDKPATADGVRNRYTYSVALYLLGKPGQDLDDLKQLTLRQVLGRAYPAMEEPDYTGPAPVLIIDQLEEVLVLDPTDWPDKECFFRELGQTLRRERVWALLAMREDYMGGLYRYLRFVPGHLRVRYRLDFLTPEEALAAAQKPAAEQGVEFTDDAARLLVDKLAYETVQSPDKGTKRLRTPYVEPFQLQVACRRLWQDWHARGANVSAIEKTDVERVDVDRALSRYYADAVADLGATSGVAQRIVREWFEVQLITAHHFRSQTTVAPVPGEQGTELLRRLREAYLIREDGRGGITWYELSHDRLIAAVLYSNRVWRHSQLAGWQRAAYRWHRNDRQPAFLLTAVELRLARSLGIRNPMDYEEEFLQESERAARQAGQAARFRNLTSIFGVIAVVEFAVILALILALG